MRCANTRRRLEKKPKQYKRYSAEFKREVILRSPVEDMTDRVIRSNTSMCFTIENVATNTAAIRVRPTTKSNQPNILMSHQIDTRLELQL